MKSRGVRRSGLFVALALIVVGIGVVAAPGFGQGNAVDDPITANRFSLTIDGFEIATFGELSGITNEAVPVEFKESGSGGPVITKTFAKVKPPTVTLKRGLTGSLELWAWFEAVRKGDIAAARRSASLTMFNSDGTPVARYFLEKAWPMKLELAGLQAGEGEALTESVTLTAESIQRVSP
jgi:phage tail-like protein